MSLSLPPMVRRCLVVSLVSASVSPAQAAAATQQMVQPTLVATSQYSTPSFGGSTPQSRDRRIDVDFNDIPLRDAIETIVAKSGVALAYSSQIIPPARRVTYAATNVSPEDAIRAILNETGLYLQRSAEGRLKLVDAKVSVVSEGIIVGRVIHAVTKQPVANAVVSLDDAKREIVTKADGTFRVANVAVGTRILSVRLMGFGRQTQQVTVAAGETTTVEVVLEPSSNVLNEVVVTGTMVATERKAIPTPITVITGEEIEKRGITRIDQFFRGEIPGVVAMERGAQVYSNSSVGQMVTSNVYSRGASTLSGGANPLRTYVDGVEILDPAYLGTIDPQSIERVEIITGPQAAAVYGASAMGGVMQIFTKRGSGASRPELQLSLTYGLLESNLSSSMAPSHNHRLGIIGGIGPEFSYSANVSYNYTGQWQPSLFNQRVGVSAGMTQVRGGWKLSGSVSTTFGRNGTAGNDARILYPSKRQTGDWVVNMVTTQVSDWFNRIVGKTSGQTLALNLDYQVAPRWQHHLTLGKNITDLALTSTAPAFNRPYDSLYSSRSTSGQRTTMNYNTVLAVPEMASVSSVVSFGLNGSWTEQTNLSGNIATKVATSYQSPGISRVTNAKNYGGFGNLRIGFFDQLYITLGLRGDHSPRYGERRAVVWTPTNGAAYTIEYRDVTLKVLGSYGRTTREPTETMALEVVSTNTNYDPSLYVSQVANDLLTPEYSHGPEVGFELYWGNIGSLSLTHYRQTVSDLIQSIAVDSVQVFRISTGDSVFLRQSQYLNTATIRQVGWEATFSAAKGPFSLKGVYSWNDSRILLVHATTLGSYPPGRIFNSVPSHIGNISLGYAFGRTSVLLVNNYVGQSLGSFTSTALYYDRAQLRIAAYGDREGILPSDFMRPGYFKSNLSLMHKISSWGSLVINIDNLGNGYGAESDYQRPALGRQTLLGVSMRFPKRS